MNKKVIIGVVVAVAVIVVFAWVFSVLDRNAPHVKLNITNGSGYSNTLNGSPNYHYGCTITNSGTMTARNVRLVARLFGMSNMGIGTETASIGDIPAGTTKNFSIDVLCPTQPIYSTDVTPLYDV